MCVCVCVCVAYHKLLNLRDSIVGSDHVTTGQDHMSTSIHQMKSRPEACSNETPDHPTNGQHVTGEFHHCPQGQSSYNILALQGVMELWGVKVTYINGRAQGHTMVGSQE